MKRITRRRRSRLADRLRDEMSIALDTTGHEQPDVVGTVQEAMRRLSDDDRELLRLTNWEGLSPSELAAATVLVLQSGGDDRTAWAAEVLEVAESAPRLLVADDDWEVTRADQFSSDMGDMVFSDGTDELELSWLPESDHHDRVQNLRENAATEASVTVAGHEGMLIEFALPPDWEEKDVAGPTFSTVWVQDGYTIEAVGRTFDNRADYGNALELLAEVDVDTWLSAMPADVVRPGDSESVVAAMLTDIPTPTGFDPSSLNDDGARERYDLGADVTSAVACSWIDQWLEATDSGDAASADEAVTAMAGSHHWAILKEMDNEGDFPGALWKIADAVGNGGIMPDGTAIDEAAVGGDSGIPTPAYQSALGCH